jgi:hypothetical protein
MTIIDRVDKHHVVRRDENLALMKHCDDYGKVY